MKKFLSPVSVFVIAGLCCAVAIEGRTIVDLTQRLRMAEARNAAAEQQARTASESARQTKAQSEIFQAESQALRKQIHGGEDVAVSADPEKVDAGANWSKTLGKMLSDPGMKKMMRSQQIMAARMMYADLIKQLGLSPADADRFFELLGDMQSEMAGKSMSILSGPGASPADAGKEVTDTSESFAAKIKDLLGADGYDQYQQYQKTVGDRMIMQQYEQQFTALGQPLDPAQSDALLQIMMDQRLKSPPTPFDTGNTNAAAQIGALQSDQAMHDFLASQTDLDQRVLQAAGQVLSPDQLAAFQKIQQQMSEMQQAGLTMSRSIFSGKTGK